MKRERKILTFLFKPILAAVDLLSTVLVVAVAAPLWLLPWEAALAVGRAYGRCGYLFWPIARRAGMINLRRAYGEEMSYEKARAWTKEVFSNLGSSIAEGIQFARRFRDPRSSWEKLYEAADPALEARILSDPRPKIFVTGHLGSWEVTMMMLALRVPEAGAAIVRRVDNPFINGLVRRLRVRSDAQWIEKRGAAAEASERLRKGESIAMLLDENGGRNGPFVTFFGRPASTRKTAALLSIMTGAPIVVGAAVRRPSTGRFLFRLALLEPRSEDRADPGAVFRRTQEIVRLYEAWVREDTLQWRWIHWRWKSRPDRTEESYRSSDLARCFGR